MFSFDALFPGLLAAVLILTPLCVVLARRVAHMLDTRAINQDILQLSELGKMASEHASDGLLIQDMKGRILWANPAYCRIHGYELHEIEGRNPLEFVLPIDETPDPEVIRNFTYSPNDPTFEKLQLHRNRHKDGHLFWNQISLSFRTSADGRENAILVCRDVTEQIEQQDRLRDTRARLQREASHDSLTGVPNRAAFLAFVKDALAQPNRAPVGLMHIDLDNFKAVNDTHGHSGGDAVLMHAATALRDAIRTGDMVARVGGDEFVVVCPDVSDLATLDLLASDLAEAMSEPFEWSNRILQCEASIGAALSPPGMLDVEDLLVQSDFALYEAKRQGRNQVALYDEDLHDRHANQTRHAAELVDAIDTGSLDYYFQPTMCLTSGRIIGLETLVRWNHPQDGLIPPDQFLPIVKEQGLMGALDLWSMSAALQQKHKLNRAGFEDIGIAFNASPELLAHPEFVNRLIWGVEAGGIDRAQVSIEVLETTNFGHASESSSNAAIIRDLRDAGFQVQLDDFGVGYAGLTHLAKLNVTGVKIDRSLVTNILGDTISLKIVRKIVELSNDLGLTVIAEGVEDHQTAVALRKMGCPIIQGYWLARPLPAADLDVWLAERGKAHDPIRA